MSAIWGKLRGKGRRHHQCTSCGRRIDLERERCWLGNGGWYCNPCGLEMRSPAGGRKAGRTRRYYNSKDLVRYGQQVLERGLEREGERHSS